MGDIRGIIKVKSAGCSKPVIHPYAKNLASGEIICTLCSIKVKSGRLWPAHILKKTHKQKAQLAKQARHARPPAQESLKRPAASMQPPGSSSMPPPKKINAANEPAKSVGLLTDYGDSDDDDDTLHSDNDDAGKKAPAPVAKANLPAGFFDEEPAAAKEAGSDAKANLPAGFFDDAPADNADTEPSSASAGTDAKSNLPAGFFDDPGEQASDNEAESPEPKSAADPTSSKSQKQKQKQKQQGPATVVPEGFFDDPVMDAKVRKVVLVDKTEVEWDRFEKEIAAQDKVSVEIVEEDFSKAMDTRIYEQVEEQKHLWKKVDVLKEKFEIQAKATAVKLENAVEEGAGEGAAGGGDASGDSDSDSDDDFEDIGWRKKGI